MSVHRSNKGGQNVPQRGPHPPKWGPKSPQKGKFVRHVRPLYLLHNDHNLPEHVGPWYHLRHTICPINLGPCPPFGGINPQKRGNDWPSATHIIAKLLWHSCQVCSSRSWLPMCLVTGPRRRSFNWLEYLENMAFLKLLASGQWEFGVCFMLHVLLTPL